MTCQLYNCDNEVKGNYTSCSPEHARSLYMHKKQLKENFDADLIHQSWNTRELYTIDMAEYYEGYKRISPEDK